MFYEKLKMKKGGNLTDLLTNNVRGSEVETEIKELKELATEKRGK
jgi:hypothetical protein